MKNIPIITNGTPNTNETMKANLYEIELAVLSLLQNALSGSVKLVVGDIDKCYTGMALYYAKADATLTKVTITKVDPFTDTITIDTPLINNLNKHSIVTEGIYESGNIQDVITSTHIRLYKGAYGALTGRVLFTDHDQPIVTEGSRVVYDNQLNQANIEGLVVYIPYKAVYSAVNVENTGKINTVSITLDNTENIIGNLIINKHALNNRAVTIKTAYLDNREKYNISLPKDTTYISMYDITTNAPFTHYCYISEDYVVTAFNGFVNSSNFDNAQASIVALTSTDGGVTTIIPRRSYTRIRCPFVFKGNRCRFISDLTLMTTITDVIEDTYILVSSNDFNFYFKELAAGEVGYIKIGDEIITIDEYRTISGSADMTSEQSKFIPYPIKIGLAIADANANRYELHIASGGRGELATAHTAGDDIDIPSCRKTAHDCRLKFNDLYFGAFPGVPKSRNNL